MNWKSYLAYGMGDFYGGGSLYIISTLYLVFLTTIVGLSPSAAGSILLLGKVWAAVANPLVGYLSDRTQSKWGRRRSWFLWGLIPIFSLLFVPVKLANESLTWAWHLIAYLLFDTLFTMVKVPYNSILAEMTDDYRERSQATGVRMFFSQGSTVIGAALPLTLVAWAGGGGRGYAVMGLVFGVLFALPWLYVFAHTWERPGAKRPAGGGFGRVFGDFASTASNRCFRLHMGMYLFAFLNLDMFNALVIFYVTLGLGMEAADGRNLISTIQASQVLALPVMTWLCVRLGNAGTYRISLCIWGCGILALAHLGNPAWILPCALLTGLGLSGSVMTPWNIQAFMADVDELITGQRREGVYAGAMQFCRQLAIGLGLFTTGKVLAWSGFVKGATVQPESVGHGVRYALQVAPLLCLGTGIMISLFFRLDPKNHRILLAEVARLKAGGAKEEVDPEVRRVCEQLTGHSYEKLWRNDETSATGSGEGPGINVSREPG